MFIAHALLKYYVFTLPGTAQFFQSLGLPGALAYLTFWAELAGGALILAGLTAAGSILRFSPPPRWSRCCSATYASSSPT